MGRIKISIIVPSYNAKEYYDECMASILNQTINDIEVICVDAGSIDGTIEIIEKYRCLDGRVQLLLSDKKSLGYQVQKGFEHATGEYLGIVEPDDFVDTDYFERCYEIAKNNDLDVLKTDHRSFVDIASERYYVELKSRNYGVVYKPRINACLYNRGEYWWNGIIKRALITENMIEINPSPKAAFQDKGFYVETLYYAQRAMWCNLLGYNYRRDNANSSTYNDTAIKNAIGEYKYIFDFLRDREDALRIRTIMFWKFFKYISRPDFIIFRPYYIDAVKKYYKESRELVLQVMKDGVRMYDVGYSTRMFLNDFINNHESFFYQLRTQCDGLIDAYNEIFDYLKSKSLNIYIFGSGEKGVELLIFLKNHMIPIKAMVDSDCAKTGRRIGDISIISVDEAVEDKGALYLISSHIHADAMEEVLLSKGVACDNIVRFSEIMHDAICVSRIPGRLTI